MKDPKKSAQHRQRIVITDRLTELIDLSQSLKAFRPQAGDASLFDALKKYIKSDNDYDVSIVLSLTYSHIWKTWDLLSCIQDDYITTRSRQLSLDAVLKYMEVFDPRNTGDRFSTLIENQMSDEIVQDVGLLVPILRKRMPLRKLSTKGVLDLIKQVEAAEEQLLKSEDIDACLKANIVVSLEHIKLMMKYMPFFGVEALMNEIGTVVGRASAFSETGENSPKTLLRVMGILVLVGHAVCLPKDVPEALHVYQTWLSRPFENLSHKERKLLPPPSPKVRSRRSPKGEGPHIEI